MGPFFSAGGAWKSAMLRPAMPTVRRIRMVFFIKIAVRST
jgi:hypothetical protein